MRQRELLWFDPFMQTWLDSGADDVNTEVLLPHGRTLQVYGGRVQADDNDQVLGVQIVDISEFVAVQLAMEHAVERERPRRGAAPRRCAGRPPRPCRGLAAPQRPPGDQLVRLLHPSARLDRHDLALDTGSEDAPTGPREQLIGERRLELAHARP